MEQAKPEMEEQLAELFSLLRAVDESRIPEHIRHAPRFLVARLEEIEIRMDADKNHARGHVHIKYKKDGHAASYAIDSGYRLAGELPRYYDRIIGQWIVKHQADLIVLWTSTQKGNRDEAILLKFQTTVYG